MKFLPPILLLSILLLLFQCAEERKEGPGDFLSFDQVKIAYTDEGKSNDPVVILFHGFISSGNSWDKTVLKKSLLEQGYRVIVPDLRGNGRSDKPQESVAYANDAEVKDLLALADHLRVKTYTAIGYSRGSIVLAKLLTQEKRIQQAVLGGMGLDFTNPNWSRRIMFAEAFGGEVALTPETEGAVNYAKSIGADLQVLSLLQHHQPVTSLSELAQVKAKTLVIAGDQDQDNGSPQELQAAIPNSELKIILGDHNNTYKGDLFAEAVMAFLTK